MYRRASPPSSTPALSLALALALPSAASAADWPRFRGPNGTGIAAEVVPLDVGDKKNLLWKVPVPGKGWSSPVVAGGKVFLQTAAADGGKRMLVCVDAADGKTAWTRQLAGSTAHAHKKNSLASGTPACHGAAVYCVVWDGESLGVQAFDAKAGKPLWNTKLGGYASQHGPGHSPVVHGGLVFVNYDQDKLAELVALDAVTGARKWAAARKPERACYSTPFLLERPGKPAELVVATTHQITAYSPATGAVAWDYPIAWEPGKMPLRAIANPMLAGGLVVCFFGDGGGSRYAVAVNPDAAGTPAKVWDARKDTPYVPCAIAWGEHLYWMTDKGTAVCAEAKTGRIVWNERVFNGDVSASPVLVGDRILAVAESGAVASIKASPDFEAPETSSLGEPTNCTPAVADGKLIIRGSTDLFCFGTKK